MLTDVHGHDVIAMIRDSRQAYTRESLITAINARFGADARFHTCSASGMDAAELVQLLAARGKLMLVDGGFTVNPDRVCRD